MARREYIQLIDDIDGESEAAETVSFSLDNSAYEIDLSDVNAKALRESLAEYINVARRAPGRTTRTGGRLVATGTKSSGAGRDTAPDPRAVRAWAQSQGMEIASRGRVSKEIVDAFVAAGN